MGSESRLATHAEYSETRDKNMSFVYMKFNNVLIQNTLPVFKKYIYPQ